MTTSDHLCVVPGYAGWTTREIRDHVRRIWPLRAWEASRVWIRRAVRAIRETEKAAP